MTEVAHHRVESIEEVYELVTLPQLARDFQAAFTDVVDLAFHFGADRFVTLLRAEPHDGAEE